MVLLLTMIELAMVTPLASTDPVLVGAPVPSAWLLARLSIPAASAWYHRIGIGARQHQPAAADLGEAGGVGDRAGERRARVVVVAERSVTLSSASSRWSG